MSAARALAALLALSALATCQGDRIRRVQRAHGREVHCDFRYVRAEPHEGSPARWTSRGCGFAIEWRCAEECRMIDLRAYGTATP